MQVDSACRRSHETHLCAICCPIMLQELGVGNTPHHHCEVQLDKMSIGKFIDDLDFASLDSVMVKTT